MSEVGFVGQAVAGDTLDLPITDEVRALIRTALDEDLRYGPDVTSAATVPADAVTDGAFVSGGEGVFAGVLVVMAVFDVVIVP
ncbi:nicotinate-nucleotide diphosphorylase (carboxylating), partial [Gordonia sp. NPDC003585]